MKRMKQTKQSLQTHILLSLLMLTGVCGLITVLALPAILYLITTNEYWIGLYFIIIPIVVGIFMKLTQ